MNDFVSLHSHSDFSRLDGAASIKDYFNRAKELGQRAFAITDHGSCNGHYDAWKAGKATGVKAILGIEAYLAPESRHEKSAIYFGTPDQKKLDVGAQGAATHMTMIALNAMGLKNLYRLQWYASTEGFYRNPRIDMELLEKHHEGILVTSGCAGSRTSVHLRLGQYDKAREHALDLQRIFGKDNFYVEVMSHGIEEDDLNDAELNKMLAELALDIGAPLVATNDAHYCNPDDDLLHDAFLCISTGKHLADEKRFKFNGSGYYLKSAEEMLETLPEYPEAILNSVVIADRVEPYDSHFEFRNRMPHLPDIDPDFENEYLEELCMQRFESMFGNHPDRHIYWDRMLYELDIIGKTGFAGYFLVLGDILSWAKSQGIRIGPARGSAGGSLVCFIQGISGVDPIKHNTPFERFLNLDRVSFPDIDVDIEITRRIEVINYTREKYGFDKVAKIGTLGTIKARSALKDANRVLGYSYNIGERLSKAFPSAVHGFSPSLACVFDKQDARYKDATELRAMIMGDEKSREVYDLAVKLEGLIRNFGVHAAGLIISSEPLKDIIPVRIVDGDVVTGFDQPGMEPMGLIKYDFLGLENLTVINRALEHIEALYGKTVEVESLPLDDTKTLNMLANGNSLGVFQLDSRPIRNLLKRMKVDSFDNITATVALYRPGPMGADAHTTYADRKTGKLRVEPIHEEFAEDLKDILQPTYGVICYQEQVMSVLQRVAGYSLGQADMVRRVMGKKKPEEMMKLEPELRSRLKERGYSDDAFQCLWDILVPFSQYAFCLAHSTGYALIAYWTAYLKANYPIAYFAALLSSEADDQEKLAQYLTDARSMGVKILPPDVNESDYGFTPTKRGIRFGLSAIKGVGESVIGEVRKRTYEDLNDFYENVFDKLNVRALQALIAGGAFDSFGDRIAHHDKAQEWLERAKTTKKCLENGDIPLIRSRFTVPKGQSGTAQMREWEKEIVGIILTLPTVVATLSRSLTDAEWVWVKTVLSGNPGPDPVRFKLGSVTFSSGQMINPSDTLVRALRASDAIEAKLV